MFHLTVYLLLVLPFCVLFSVLFLPSFALSFCDLYNFSSSSLWGMYSFLLVVTLDYNMHPALIQFYYKRILLSLFGQSKDLRTLSPFCLGWSCYHGCQFLLYFKPQQTLLLMLCIVSVHLGLSTCLLFIILHLLLCYYSLSLPAFPHICLELFTYSWNYLWNFSLV